MRIQNKNLFVLLYYLFYYGNFTNSSIFFFFSFPRIQSSHLCKTAWLSTYPGSLCLFLEDFLHLHGQVLHQFQAIDFLHSDCLREFFMFLKTNQTHTHAVTGRQNICKLNINNNNACRGKKERNTVLMDWAHTAHQPITVLNVHLIRGRKTSSAFQCCCSFPNMAHWELNGGYRRSHGGWGLPACQTQTHAW